MIDRFDLRDREKEREREREGAMEPIKSVQTFGRKKTAVAVAYCKEVRKEERESERKKKCVCVCVCVL